MIEQGGLKVFRENLPRHLPRFAMSTQATAIDSVTILIALQGYHIEKQIFAKEELQNLEADIDDSLRRAGGANYDLGNIRTGVQAGKSTDLKNAVRIFEPLVPSSVGFLGG